MLEAAVVVLRLAQYAGATILMGSSLFFVYALPREGAGSATCLRWARPLLISATAFLALTALLGIAAQASLLAGSLAEGVKPETLAAVVSGLTLGKAAMVRAAAAGLALILLLGLRPGPAAWISAAGLGAVAAASLAFMGHAAASEGPARTAHLASDLVHCWAASMWLGALVAFGLLLRARPPAAAAAIALHRALRGFGGVGTVLVALVLFTGIVNSWFLVGPDHIDGLWTTPYGRLLSLKAMLVVTMLGLAAANRFRFTPALGRALDPSAGQTEALAALRKSVLIESAMGFAVLALVAGFGTMPPPAAL